MPKRLVHPLPTSDVRIGGGFWQCYQELVRTTTIPYQWGALNDEAGDAEPSHCIHNFRVAAGLEEGEFLGEPFQDSDLYKWIEAASWTLAWHPDDELCSKVDSAIELIAAAQQPDGYVDTYYIINGLEGRFTNLRGKHELYCMGHLIEAACANYQVTGSRKLLDVACRYADCVAANIGPEEGKIHGYPGHEIAEMALVGLARLTGERRYVDLASYFVDQRGQSPLFFEWEGREHGNPFRWGDTYMKYQYYQAGKPIREQRSPEGHAVRDVYMYSGVADVAEATGDDGLFEVAEDAFRAMAGRQMYITGGIGASEHGECFTFDYDLPNDTAYAETCASVGLVFWCRRMLELTGDGRYADVMERALYNGTISGMSLDGTRFFYVNPLEVDPEACEKDYNKRHVKPERQKWFGCACCPPNLARLVASLGNYAYSASEDSLWVNLYAGGEARCTLAGVPVRLAMQTNYPWDGKVELHVDADEQVEFELRLRVPGWCDEFSLEGAGEPADAKPEAGYLRIRRAWEPDATVVLTLGMRPRVMAANPRVVDDAGKVALMRGPVVYCAEQADNGPELQELRLDPTAEPEASFKPDLLGGVVALACPGVRISDAGWGDELYQPYHVESAPTTIRLVPYFAWGNRGLGEMSVWLRTTATV